MGKEWLYWGGSGSGNGNNRSTKRARSETASSGCMSAVLQIFDLHHYIPFALNQHHHQQPSFRPPDSFLPQDPPILLKGVEAPRNSLELDEPFNAASSLSPSIVKQQNLNIPTGIQIKTSADARSSRTDDYSSEFSSSPGTKTPNLVARLMGLDLLPESSSPCSNPQSKSRLHPRIQSLKEDIRSRKCRSANHRNCSDSDFSGTRSLPETPRISSARRSDVDHHRYSLQINKENNEEIEFSSYLTAKMGRRIVQEDENRSPGHYARQIVKQVKESVSRRVGADITNTAKNREERRDQELVVLLKSKKLSNRGNGDESTDPSCSPRPRLRFLDHKPVSSSVGKIQNPKLSSSSSSLRSSYSHCAKVTNKPPKSSTEEKCKKVGGERYGSRLKKPPQTSDLIRNKQEEPFVRSPTKNRSASHSEKKCKKIPLMSSNFININVPVKKDPSPSPTTRLPQNQGEKQSPVIDGLSSKRSTRLTRNLSLSYKQEEATHTHTVQATHTHTVQHNSNHNGAEFEYISTILRRTGIHSNTPVSFTNWYSPSHPLDPSIFNHLEITHPTLTTATSALDHRSNRKLIFELVDELLVEILRPYINLKPWIPSINSRDYDCDCEMNGSQLIQRLYWRIGRFPAADCRVLEDIDGLIGEDLGKSSQLSMAMEEESEGIVREIEREILETMVHETAMAVWGVRTV